jgi:hypothetical protein
MFFYAYDLSKSTQLAAAAAITLLVSNNRMRAVGIAKVAIASVDKEVEVMCYFSSCVCYIA